MAELSSCSGSSQSLHMLALSAYLHGCTGLGDQGSVECRCGNVAAILELDEHLNKSFKVTPLVENCFTLSMAAALQAALYYQWCGSKPTCGDIHVGVFVAGV